MDQDDEIIKFNERFKAISQKASERASRSSLGTTSAGSTFGVDDLRHRERRFRDRTSDRKNQESNRWALKKVTVRSKHVVDKDINSMDQERDLLFRAMTSSEEPSEQDEKEKIKFLLADHFRTPKHMHQSMKGFDFGYRMPESCGLRYEQIEVLEKETNTDSSKLVKDIGGRIDAIWLRTREIRYTYKDYRKDREILSTATMNDPLCLMSDIDMPPESQYNYNDTVTRGNGSSFNSDVKSEVPKKPMSSDEIEKSVGERKRKMQEERERQRRAYEETKRKRLEAIEYEKQEKIRRDRMNLNRTLLNKKMIEETRRLPKELKEFDLIGSILMPQVKASMKAISRETKKREEPKEIPSSTSDGPSGATFYCEVCDMTMISMTDNIRHCNSVEHIVKKQQYNREHGIENGKLSNPIEEYYSKQKITPKPEKRKEPTTAEMPNPDSSKQDSKEPPKEDLKEAEELPAEESIDKLRPDSPDSFRGGTSPCLSNAPSVDSDNEEPLSRKSKPIEKITLSLPSPPPEPDSGLAIIAHLLKSHKKLSLQQLHDMQSFQIKSEEEAHLAKEILRSLDDNMYKYLLQSVKTNKKVLDSLKEKSLLRE